MGVQPFLEHLGATFLRVILPRERPGLQREVGFRVAQGRAGSRQQRTPVLRQRQLQLQILLALERLAVVEDEPPHAHVQHDARQLGGVPEDQRALVARHHAHGHARGAGAFVLLSLAADSDGQDIGRRPVDEGHLQLAARRRGNREQARQQRATQTLHGNLLENQYAAVRFPPKAAWRDTLPRRRKEGQQNPPPPPLPEPPPSPTRGSRP